MTDRSAIVSRAAEPSIPQGLVTTGILLVSLHSYYFYEVGLAPFPLAGLLLLSGALAIDERSRVSTVVVPVAWTLAAIFAIWTVLAFLSSNIGVRPQAPLGAFAGLLAFVVFDALRTCAPRLLILALRTVLKVHVAVLIVQTASYYGLGVYLDFLAPVTGEAQRMLGPEGIDGLIRPTGLFNEPATYAVTMAGLLVALHGMSGPLGRLGWVVVATIAATLSLSGLLLASAYAVLHGLGQLRTRAMLALSIASIFAGAIGALVASGALPFSDYVIERLSSITTDTSFLARYGRLLTMADQGDRELLFGHGLGVQMFTDALDGKSHVGSSLTFLVFHFGYVGASLVVVAMTAYMRLCGATVRHILMWAVLLSGTATIVHLFFWLFLVVLPRPELDR